MDKWIKASTCTAILLAGSGVFYYHVVFLPGLERTRAAETTRPVSALQAELDQCRRTAQLHYDLNWASACLAEGDPHPDCTLRDARAAVINGAYQDAENRCVVEARARR